METVECYHCGEICELREGDNMFTHPSGECKPKKASDMASYAGGAKRSSKLPRYELIDPAFLDEVAEVMGVGAVNYGELNWQKGEQEFVQDIPRHMLLHVFGIMSGDTSENHLANLICNGIMLAKLRKKYPYQVPGAPEQLTLQEDMGFEALLKDTGERAPEEFKEFFKPKLNLASLESQLERIEKNTREFPQSFKPEEVSAADIIGQCRKCSMDVTQQQDYYIRHMGGKMRYAHFGPCPRSSRTTRRNNNAQA